MPRKVSRGTAVSGVILLTLAVTTQYVSRVPGAPPLTIGPRQGTGKSSDSQQKSTDTVDRDARTHYGGFL